MISGHEKGIYRCTAAGDSLSGTLHVSYVRWVGATTAGHECILRERDGTGVIVFASLADGDNFLDVMAIKRWLHGFYVDVLDSGVLYVYTY